MGIAITVHIRRSRILAVWLAAACILVALTVWRIAPAAFNLLQQTVWSLFGMALCGLICIIWYRRHALVQLLTVAADGRMILTADVAAAPHYRSAARLIAPALVWPGLLILRLSGEDGRRHCLLIFSDAVDPDSFRRLKVALLWLRQRGMD